MSQIPADRFRIGHFEPKAISWGWLETFHVWKLTRIDTVSILDNLTCLSLTKYLSRINYRDLLRIN
jgi:hypothetical protein